MPPDSASPVTGQTLELLAALAFAATIAAALALIAGGLVRRLITSIEGHAPLTGRMGRAPVHLVRLVTFTIAMIALVFPVVAVVGVELPVEMGDGRMAEWTARMALRIGVILLLAVIAARVVASVIARAEHEMAGDASSADVERRKRANTIGRTLSRFLASIIWATALLMALRAFDIDITPVLTGAGILGLAVGFGAQTLVKDVISGFFLILEDQVRVGDVALVNGVGGAVEAINLRTIVMRDLEGTVHVIPNGEIRTLANRSKDFSYFVLDIGIDYDDDVDEATEGVREAAASLMDDPVFGPQILEPLEVLGLNNFDASSVTLRFRIKTLPLSQWAVGRELRRRVKQAFDRRGVRIPFPQMVVTLRNGPAGTPGDRGEP